MPSILNIITEDSATNSKAPISKTKTLSAQFFLHYHQNVHKIYNILKKELSLVAWVFWKLLTAKNGETLMHRRSSIRTSLGSQRVDVSQRLHKYAKANFS